MREFATTISITGVVTETPMRTGTQEPSYLISFSLSSRPDYEWVERFKRATSAGLPNRVHSVEFRESQLDAVVFVNANLQEVLDRLKELVAATNAAHHRELERQQREAAEREAEQQEQISRLSDQIRRLKF